jgi:hypothetical protein
VLLIHFGERRKHSHFRRFCIAETSKANWLKKNINYYSYDNWPLVVCQSQFLRTGSHHRARSAQQFWIPHCGDYYQGWPSVDSFLGLQQSLALERRCFGAERELTTIRGADNFISQVIIHTSGCLKLGHRCRVVCLRRIDT